MTVSGDGPGRLPPVGYATGIGFRDDRVGWLGVRYHGRAGAPGRVPIELYRSVDGGRSWRPPPCPPGYRAAPRPAPLPGVHAAGPAARALDRR